MEPHQGINEPSHELAGDLLRGADQIAAFIFGDKASRRKVYYLAECCRLPIFRLGATLCMRPSAYRQWIENQEARAIPVKRTN